MAVGHLVASPPQHQQIVQSDDRFAGIGGKDSAVGIDAPITRGTGKNQVARFRVDEHIAQALQTREREHLGIERLAGGLAASDFALQPRK